MCMVAAAEDYMEMEYEDPTLFEGIRFVLSGYDPLHHDQLKNKLVSWGGVYVPNYSPDCTHVIVYNLLLDDPICVAAIRDGKVLRTHLWLEHTFDNQELASITNIMYRPRKSHNGIPGAENLIICLTGYPKPDRDDIMILVELMGAEFFKSLVPTKVTHLVCYKFEGEKYAAAKKYGVKLVNHHWLQDCLDAWKILPEEHYSTCSYDLEMMGAQVKDSDDETENVSTGLAGRRVTNDIPILQNQTGQALDNSVIASRAPTLPGQGLSNNVTKDEARLPVKPEQVSESRNFQKIDNHSPMRQDNDEQNVKKTPVKSGHPVHVGKASGKLTGPNSKRSADSLTDNITPLNSIKAAKRSKASAGKSGNSNRKKENVKSDDVRTSDSEVDKVKVASGCFGALNSKGLSEVDASKYNASSPRRSSLSLQSAARLTTPEGILEDLSASELFGAPNTEAVQPDVQGVFALDQMNQLADNPDVSHSTPKSQKLMASASKRIDAEEPATPVSSPLRKSKSGPFGISCHTGNETARASAEKSYTDLTKNRSDKSNVKNPALSRSLAYDKAQFSKSDNMDTRTSPTSGKVCVLSGVKNNKVEPQNPPENVSYSPELKKLVAPKSVDVNLNSDEQTGSSGSKPPRKKMVARKMLGSRPRVSKKAALDKKGSLLENISGDKAGQIEGQAHVNSSVPDKIVAPPLIDAFTALESSPLHDAAVDINDHDKDNCFNERVANLFEPSNDDTEYLDDFVVQQRYSTKSSPLREPGAVATSGMLHCDIEEAEATFSSLANTDNKGMPAAKLNGVKQAKKNLAPKKGISGRAKEKTVISEPKVVQDADAAVHEIASEKNEQTAAAAGKKRRGGQLAKRPVQDDTELTTSNDPGACDGSKPLGNLALKKRRGALLSKKSDTPVEVEKEVEATLDNDDQHDLHKQPEKVPDLSNLKEVLMGVENENGRCNNNGVKQTGKKRRGTLLLNKSDVNISAGKENMPVPDGKPKKLSGTSKLTKSNKNGSDPNNGDDQGAIKGKKVDGKKRRGTLVLNKAEGPVEVVTENEPVFHDHEDKSEGEVNLTVSNDVSSDPKTSASDLKTANYEPAWFIVSGHRLQRKEFQQLIKRLRGKHCRDSHQWSYQATHFIVPDPIRRTEKFFAAAASGRWILKTDYLTASSQAGKFLSEEPYEWHKNGLTEDGAINLGAPRKWRLLREKTGHGAFYGMRIVVYGECIAPTLDTLKRAVKAGDGTILATSPPYTRFLDSGVDFAIVSPGMPRVDKWVQEFLSHEIPCVTADYLVEYVCKPGYPLDRHVQYNTQEWAARSFARLSSLSIKSVADAATPENQVTDDLACEICGSSDRAEVMLVCGDESGFCGCGIGTHIDCCDPPLEDIPEEDWFCPKCTKSKATSPATTKKKTASTRS